MLSDEQIIKLGVNISKDKAKGANWAAVVTFDRHARMPRFFLIDVKNERIHLRTHTTHGSGSGGLSGLGLKFSNTPNSHQSSIGLMKCSEEYYSTKFNGASLRLDGLESINSNVRRRAIVIHPSDYVSSTYIRNNGQPGRSQGCFALGRHVSDEIVDKLKNGSMLFAVAPDNLELALSIIKG